VLGQASTGFANYSGNIAVSGGTLRLVNQIGAGNTSGKTITIASGAALDVQASGVPQNVTLNGAGISSSGALINASTTVAGGVTGPVNLATSSSIGGAGALPVSGVISGAAGANLTKVGAGSLTLAGNNTYAGTTTASAGTLLVTGSIAASTTDVNTGATLGGTGTTGPLNINTGATLSPGMSIGTLKTGALSLNGTATFKLEINTGAVASDLVNVVGSLTIDPANTTLLTVTDLGTNVALPVGTTLTMISYSGTWNGGTFSGMADDSTFAVGANSFRISYNDPTGAQSAVTLTAVPEPGAIFSLSSGFVMLVGLSRRRRS
jgi:autotransporter-associated beta strand protein